MCLELIWACGPAFIAKEKPSFDTKVDGCTYTKLTLKENAKIAKNENLILA